MNYKVQNLTKQQTITTSLLPIEFYDSFNFCQENKSKIDSKILDQLDFIAQKLLMQFADEKKKQYLFQISNEKIENPVPTEYKFMQNTSKELLIKIYIETVKNHFPESTLYFPNMSKKAVLHVRSQTLKIWNERVLELNYNDKILSIFKIAQKNKGDKNLDLNTYALKWVGKVKNRFSFRLDSLSSQNRYKNFRIASEFFEIAIEWFENIKTTLMPQLTLTNYADLKIKYEEIYLGKEKEDNVGFVEDNKKSKWASLFLKKPHEKNDNKETKKQKNNEKKETKEPKDKSNLRGQKSVDAKFTSHTPSSEKESEIYTENLRKSMFPTLEASAKNNANINKSNPTELNENKEHKTSNELSENNKKNNVSKNSPVLEENSKIEHSFEEEQTKENQMKNMEEENIEYNVPLFNVNQENIFKNLNRKTSCPNIVQDILCNIDKEDVISELDYTMLESFENFRILRHNSELNKYKIFIKVKSPWKDILKNFQDPLKYKLLNKEIQELKILSIIQYNKSSIIYEKRKAYGRLYLPREFVYMRYIYEKKDSMIIVDRSIDFNDIPHSYFSPTIRGSILSNVIFISKNSQNNVLICFNVNTMNNGVVSSHQDHELNYTFLKQFRGLEMRFSVVNTGTEEIPTEEIKNEEFMKTELSLLDEKSIRKKTKFLTALDRENKEKIMAGLLLKEETEVIISKKRSTSMEAFQPIKEEPNENIEEKHKESEVEKDMVQRNRELSFAFQKSSEILTDMIENNFHILRCITTKHNMNNGEVRIPRLQQSTEVEGHYVLKRTDWISNKTGGFIYHNQKVLDVQKKILGYLLKRMGTNLIQGKSIMSISLPIELFETKSHLEKLAYNFTFAPYFMNKANEVESVLEQMKNTICFFITTLHMATAQLKPFNPVLGETFQGRINGMPIYLEQVSHHPPISSILLYGNQFKLIGNYEAHASLHANSCIASILGSPRVIYKNGTVIYGSIPHANIGGTSFGQRTFNYEGKSFAYEPKHMLVCELTFNPDKKGLVGGLFKKQQNPNDYFSGAVYQVNQNCIENIQKVKVLNKYEGLNMKEDVIKEVCKVNGIWHKYVEIDGVKYWEFGKNDAYELEYERNPLPSDSIYREDIISWRSEDVQKSQIIKEKVENQQRDDRKLRGKKLGKDKEKKKSGH